MPSIWDKLRGHREQREMFRRTLSRGRLSQGYLLTGPEGVGKRLFAQCLAECLLCRRHTPEELEACGECAGCRPFQAGSHPDFLTAACPEGKRELPIEVFVGPKERRGQAGLCFELSLRPLPDSRKIAIIDDADLMNDAAANALLKTLEEPPEGAILFLIASNPDALLPTIRSRCQMVRFSALSPADVAALLLEQELTETEDEAKLVAALSEGSLAHARRLLDPELRQLRSVLYDQLAHPQELGIATARELQEGLDKLASETADQRNYALWLVRFAAEFQRSALWKLCEGSQVESLRNVPRIEQADAWVQKLRVDPQSATESLMTVMDRTLQTAEQIDQYASVPLCLEAWFADLARLSQPLLRR
ncbi:MAG: DNA polymerase III subunit delta' [Planctomycetaceae bacterium]